MNFEFVLLIPILLFSLSLHEYAHGRVAYEMGDPTPKITGRLTLNPLAHLSLMGTLVLLITQLFGWAKPVRVDPRHFDDPRKGMMYVGLAGPTANILLAVLLGLSFRFFGPYLSLLVSNRVIQFLYGVFAMGIMINIALAFFNLLPIPPLDGSKILKGLLPRKYDKTFAQLEAYGPFILLLVIMTGGLRYILIPITNFFLSILLGI